jgi:hypothetical protein
MAIASALIGAAAAIGGAAFSSGASKSAANKVAEGNAAAIAEQRRQFDRVQQLLSPYVQGGNEGLQSLLGLIGAQGAPAQQKAVNAFQQTPMFQGLVQQGENAILQNASATGGLRGGNVQGALAQFRPALLNQQIQQQIGNLGGLATMGANAAAGVGTAGQSMGNNVSALLANTGQAQAAGGLASGQAWGNALGSLGGIVGNALGAGGGGLPSIMQSQNIALASLAGTGGLGRLALPPLPGIITGYGSGTFDINGRQVTF